MRVVVSFLGIDRFNGPGWKDDSGKIKEKGRLKIGIKIRLNLTWIILYTFALRAFAGKKNTPRYNYRIVFRPVMIFHRISVVEGESRNVSIYLNRHIRYVLGIRT